MQLNNQIFWAQYIDKKEQDAMYRRCLQVAVMAGAMMASDQPSVTIAETLLESDVNHLRLEYANCNKAIARQTGEKSCSY